MGNNPIVTENRQKLGKRSRMLTYLHVKNLALIDEAEVEFGPGLNILTGETGAGKSILMGSVNLALGQKMSREMLRDEEKPALVELIFQVDNPRCVERLKEKEISVEEGQIIISRKLTGNRSISRLNGEVCTAAQIREISSLLLDTMHFPGQSREALHITPGSFLLTD